MSGFAEDLNKEDFPTPGAYVLATCEEKAKYLQRELTKEASQSGADIIICADTIVALPPSKPDDPWRIMEKPSDQNHAREQLSSLSGRTHHVITAVTVLFRSSSGWDASSFKETTKVTFCPLEVAEIEAYVTTEEP